MAEDVYQISNPLVGVQIALTTDRQIVLLVDFYGEDGPPSVQVVFPSAEYFAGVVDILTQYRDVFAWGVSLGADEWPRIEAFCDSINPNADLLNAFERLKQFKIGESDA